jgi:hypothetical protein
VGLTNVRVDGNFETQAHKLNFVPTGLKVSILPIPGFVTRQIFSRLNPIADFTKLYIKAEPDYIRSVPGRLYVITKGMKDKIQTSKR